MRRLPRVLSTASALVALAGTLLLTGCTGKDNTTNSPSDSPVTTTTSLPGPTGSGGASPSTSSASG
jgi:uncharacterized lipoprotein YajG